MNIKFINKGFTLVELLVVMAILGLLVSVIGSSFINSQMRGRDAQRKSDLTQVAKALELYNTDYGRYPASSNGLILGCRNSTCEWGSDEFTDLKTIYMKTMVQDPTVSKKGDPDSRYEYYYVASDDGQMYQLYAYIENTEDKDIDSDVSSKGISCGVKNCNYGVSSPNTTPAE